MRLNSEKSKQTATEIKKFVDWILHIGDGDLDLNELGQTTIEIPQYILILNVEQPLLHLVEFVYPGYMQNLTLMHFLMMVQYCVLLHNVWTK